MGRAIKIDPGDTFGEITVLEFAYSGDGLLIPMGRYYNCKCNCGNTRIVNAANLVSGRTWYCCNARKRARLNKCDHPLFTCWDNMRRRCFDAHHPYYKYYGGRGIKVCERWLSFDNFVEDMFPTFKRGLTIERIDNSKGYELDNCRWATMKEQAQNRRPKYTSLTQAEA